MVRTTPRNMSGGATSDFLKTGATMTELKIGDIEKLAQAVADNPATPDVGAYLMTLGLAPDELESVKERMADVNRAVRAPGDSPVPTIVASDWL